LPAAAALTFCIHSLGAKGKAKFTPMINVEFLGELNLAGGGKREIKLLH